jgi:hypothetical protein
MRTKLAAFVFWMMGLSHSRLPTLRGFRSMGTTGDASGDFPYPQFRFLYLVLAATRLTWCFYVGPIQT